MICIHGEELAEVARLRSRYRLVLLWSQECHRPGRPLFLLDQSASRSELWMVERENRSILTSTSGPLHTGVIPGRYANNRIRCILWCWSSVDDNEEGGESWEGMEKHYLEMLNVDHIVRRQFIWFWSLGKVKEEQYSCNLPAASTTEVGSNEQVTSSKESEFRGWMERWMK